MKDPDVSANYEKTGTLRAVRYHECNDCGTRFPEQGGAVVYNGQVITLCPWCRPDSEPWKHGRGR